jgi:hypothetical protein
MNYGIPIGDFKPDREHIYDMFTEYFNNPKMTKIKNTDNLSMYLTKTYCLTSTTCRYIIVFVPQNNSPLGSSEYLKDLKWVSLQTRTLEEKFPSIKYHGYIPEEKGPLLSKIHRTDITKEVSTYKCDDYPIIVTLLHDTKKNSDTYQNSGNIVIALETWNTIVTWVN